MKYQERPTIKSNYTKEDLKNYAKYRKSQEIKTIKNVLNDSKVLNGDIATDEHEEYREALALSREIVIDIQLSTGGDADGFKLTFNEHKELQSGVYYWADWGVYEEIILLDDEIELVDSLYMVSDWLAGY